MPYLTHFGYSLVVRMMVNDMLDKITEKQDFLNVFPELRLSSELHMYAEALKVIRITKEGNAHMARIYTISNRLISKDVILQIEDALYRQVFGRFVRNVRILDRYYLGKDLDAETVFNEYRGSIEEELSRYFHREYRSSVPEYQGFRGCILFPFRYA